MPPTRFIAPGSTTRHGTEPEKKEMTVEAQSQVMFLPGDKTEASVFIRVGVAPKPNDRPLDDLAENAIKLTLDQARSFAASILKEVDDAEGGLNA